MTSAPLCRPTCTIPDSAGTIPDSAGAQNTYGPPRLQDGFEDGSDRCEHTHPISQAMLAANIEIRELRSSFNLGVFLHQA